VKMRALRAYLREQERAEELRARRLREGKSVADLQVGSETLRRMASVSRYNDFIWQRLRPYAGQRILEVGCGIGNFTYYFVDREKVVAVDPVPEAIESLQTRYLHTDHVLPAVGDILNPELVASLKPLRFDTVICVNVLEHIPDDELALRHMYEVLEPGGRLLLLVPAGRWLYGTLDYYLDHYRRYKYSEVVALMERAGFRIETSWRMNLPGILGWWLNARILRRPLLPSGQLRLFNFLMPIFRLEEKLNLPLGLSIVAIGKKD